MLAVTDFPDLSDCQSLLFGALPLSLSLSCRSLASWIFASQFLSLILALSSFAIQPLFELLFIGIMDFGITVHFTSFALCSFATQLLLELLSIGSPAFTFISQWTLPSP